MLCTTSGGKRVIISLVDHNENLEFESIGKIVQIVDHHKKQANTSLPAAVGVTQLEHQQPQDIFFQEQLANQKNGKEIRHESKEGADPVQDTVQDPVQDNHKEVVNNKSNISHGNNSNIKEDKIADTKSCHSWIEESEINERVGSCSSLVAKRYLHSIKKSLGRNHASQDEEDPSVTSKQDIQEEEEVDVQVALLLYGPVILGESLLTTNPSVNLNR